MMHKQNWIILILFVIASVCLLAAWYLLGFNYVDSPLDLVLSIVWWIIIVVGGIAIYKTEQMRRERVRTIFIGTGVVFNPEAGLINTSQQTSIIECLEGIISNLDYSFEKRDFPKKGQPVMDCIVHTKKYKAAASSNETHSEGQDACSEPTWEGNVTWISRPNQAIPFTSRNELALILKVIM